MRKIVITLLALGIVAATSAFAANDVRISQVYGGGGAGATSGATYTKDYVELFNAGPLAVNLGGFALQYGSATGTSFGSTTGNMFVFPAGTTIQPCGYLLIELGTAGAGGVAISPTPDFSSTNINMSATSGKIALVNNSNLNNICGTAGVFIDVVGYGTANCYETAAAPILDNASIDVRGGGGMTDTDNNSTDFTKVAAPGYLIHNSSSPRNPDCLAVPAKSTTWGQVKTIYR